LQTNERMIVTKTGMSRISTLQCSACDRLFSVYEVNTYATCEKCGKSPLISRYDLLGLQKEDIDHHERSMWRYAAVLPVFDKKNIITLGEGWTPLLPLARLSGILQIDNLSIKDESQNPTGSFKARGLSMAISKAKEFGITDCIIPTAGNAGGAMAAYCARAGIKATVVMPKHTPRAFKMECQYFGASLVEVDGLISDCAKKVAEMNSAGHYFDLSTMKEPYRLEGKKTMGYEIAEQSGWQLPDVILYPTGGGTGLIGMWKAFHEMMALGWLGNKMPRLIAVQSENCKPVVDSFFENKTPAPGKPTIANGLAVPHPFAHKLILQVLHETGGSAISVSEEEIVQGVKEIASAEGMFVAPEGGALLAALKKLIDHGQVHRDEQILLLNTGSAYKYIENL
jgi:threonine synthase